MYVQASKLLPWRASGKRTKKCCQKVLVYNQKQLLWANHLH